MARGSAYRRPSGGARLRCLLPLFIGGLMLIGALLLVWALVMRWMLPQLKAPGLGMAPAPSTEQIAAAGPMRPAAGSLAIDPAHLQAETTQLQTLRGRWQRSSLRGSSIDGEVAFDERGRLRMTPDLRRRFEYYLALLGEFSVADLKRLLLEDVREAHGEAAMAAVQAAFERYLGLRQASTGIAAGLDIEQRHAALQALRRQWFGADADSLFADEIAHDAYTLERLRLAQLPQPLAEQAQNALRALRPARVNAEEDLAHSGLLADEQTRQFEAMQLDPSTRSTEREALWGALAAARLEALDRERAAWEQRLRDYAIQRARVSADHSLDPSARERALRDLINARFEGPERVRVLSLQDAGLLPTG
jgi:lipase chaperone LimK